MQEMSAMEQIEPMKIWPFHKAPQEYRDLSPHGGDEDWIAYVPASWGDIPFFIEEGSRFGCCDVSQHRLPDGAIIAIGAHA
jgi:hypothetical protein